MGHLGESHLAPFRNSLVFSRRQRLQSAPVYRAIAGFLPLHPAPLGRAAAIVRNRGDVLDRADLQAGRLERPDGGLPARARTLHEHVNLAHAVLHGPAGGGLSGHLRGERRGLARALESDLPGRRPGNDAAAGVGDRDNGVVERALDMGVPVSDVLPLFPAYLLGGAGATLRWHPLPRFGGGRTAVCAASAWAGAAPRTTSSRPSSCRPRSSSCPSWCGRWSACAARARAARGD